MKDFYLIDIKNCWKGAFWNWLVINVIIFFINISDDTSVRGMYNTNVTLRLIIYVNDLFCIYVTFNELHSIKNKSAICLEWASAKTLDS